MACDYVDTNTDGRAAYTNKQVKPWADFAAEMEAPGTGTNKGKKPKKQTHHVRIE